MADRTTQVHPEHPRAYLAIIQLSIFLLLVLVPWEQWMSHKPDLAKINQGISWAHPLGFDNLGRDLLIRVAAALRSAVLPLWGAVSLGAILGGLLGWLANLCPSQRLVSSLDAVMMAICSLPVGVVAFAWAALREQTGLFAVMASLAPLAGALFFLRIRDLMQRDEHLAFWQAHIATGGTRGDRLWRYGICGAWSGLLSQLLGFLLRVAVAVEAALSYLGFGVAEPQPSLGNILAAHFERYLRGDWRVLAIVALALALAATIPDALLTISKWLISISENTKKISNAKLITSVARTENLHPLKRS